MATRIVTHSEASCFTGCRLEWYFKYDQRLTTKTRSVALNVGVLVHEGVYGFYSTGSKEHAYESLAGLAGEMRTKLVKNHGEALTDEEMKKLVFGEKLAQALLWAYLEVFVPMDNFELALPEEPFLISMLPPGGKRASSKYKYAGRTDMIVRMRGTGRPVLLENKTKGIIDEEALYRDDQVLRYLHAKQRETGWEINDVIWRILLRPQLRISKVKGYMVDLGPDKTPLCFTRKTDLKNYLKDESPSMSFKKEDYPEGEDYSTKYLFDREETLDEYHGRVLDDVRSRPEHYARQFYITYPQSEIDRAGERLHHIASDMHKPSIYRCPGVRCMMCNFKSDLCIEDSPQNRAKYYVRPKLHPELPAMPGEGT